MLFITFFLLFKNFILILFQVIFRQRETNRTKLVVIGNNI
jgi:hypothetical protein